MCLRCVHASVCGAVAGLVFWVSVVIIHYVV